MPFTDSQKKGFALLAEAVSELENDLVDRLVDELEDQPGVTDADWVQIHSITGKLATVRITAEELAE